MSDDRRHRWTRATRQALLACLAAAGMLAGAGRSQAETGTPLPDAHVGVALVAPTAPTVGGRPADSVQRTWQRCRRFATFVSLDRPLQRIALDGGETPGALVGDPGAATRFDGIHDAVVVADNGVLAGTHPFTIELWARPTLADARYRFLVSRESRTAAGREGTGIWHSSAGLGFERWTNGVKAGITFAPGLAVGAWSHVVASYDGAQMRLFVNGAQVGSRRTETPLHSAAATVVGAGEGASTGFFSGMLDGAAIYDHAVSRSHVAAHASAGRTAPCVNIAGAGGDSYTPTLADLGTTLRVITTARATGVPEYVVSVNDTLDPVDDGGQLVHPVITSPAVGASASGTVQITAAVAGPPLDRIEFLVDGVVRYAKSEPPFQYTWYTAAERNSRHTVAVRVLGPGSSVPAVAELEVPVSNRTIYPTPLPLGQESMYAELGEGDPATANNLLDDVWPARGFPLAKLVWPLTWREDPYGDAYWRFYHYGLRPESSLLYLWQTTGAGRYLDKLLAILGSFAAYDETRPQSPLTFDNNHAAAYRAMALVNMTVKLRRAGVLPPHLERSLVAAIARLGEFLAAPRHFEGGVNHGFNEGAALLLVADNFPSLPGSAGWRQTALDRLQGMLTTTLDDDGVEIENSPFYHIYVLGLVYQIAAWARAYEPTLAPSYAEAAQEMLRFAGDVTQPNGYLPMLGATATTFVPSQDPTVYGPMADAHPGFAYAYTRGARGSPPPDGTVLYPSSGLFLMRSPRASTSSLSQQTFVTFDAGAYRTDHSDLDALGITIYTNGSTVLPESGLFTYTQQPERSYFHGTRAHNTVVVDGNDQAAGAARPGTHGESRGTTWATGTSDLYAGVTHRRGVVVLRQGLVLVVDRLVSTQPHTYTQTWHLPPDASTEVHGIDVTARDAAGRSILALAQSDPVGATIATVRGQIAPTLQGWYSSSYGAKTPATAVEVSRTGTAATFATLLAAGSYAAQESTVSRTALAGADRIAVCVGGSTGYTVVLPAGDGAAVISGGPCSTAPTE